MHKILAVNPGSTSTKISCCIDDKKIFDRSIPIDDTLRASYKNIMDQLDLRYEQIWNVLCEIGETEHFDAVIGRGGLLAPMESGTYFVNSAMQEYLKRAPRGEHASNLGAFLASRFAEKFSCPAFIADPVSVDEMSETARISGAPEIERVSLVHALNQKAVARIVAERIGKKYEDCRFVVAHLGTGITMGAHINGRIVDVIGAKADGPFSPERAGGLPADLLIDLCFSGKYGYDELRKKLLSGWGMFSYLGTRDIREALKMAEKDAGAAVVVDAMAYQIAKGIGELATVLKGEIDAVVLTGGMAYSEPLMSMISERVRFIAPIEIVPGEDELEALTLAALRVLRGEEAAKNYI